MARTKTATAKSARGFAAMKLQGREEEIRKIAKKGGQSSHKND